MTTYLLHGFWGQPQDWNTVISTLPLGCELRVPDLYEPGPLAAAPDLTTWVTEFWRHVDSAQPIQLVGYSMGGRLALNAVMAQPQRVRRALLLSTRPTLPASEVASRAAWEVEWAQKFLNLPWSELDQQWQELSVFTGSAALPRRKTHALREMLASSLTAWSPRQHPFSLNDLNDLKDIRIDWAFGALDQNYLNVAKTLQELPVRGQISIIPGAGHRLLVDRPEFIGQWIQNEGL